MPNLDDDRPAFALDDEGYLVDGLAWTPEVAEKLARASGLFRLTADHWKVISCYREAAARHRRPPSLAALTQLAGIPLAELQNLFPFHTAELVARLAGSRKPSGG